VTRLRLDAALPYALMLALSAGVIDVCVALLNKPRGFETVTALSPAILATAAVALAVYVALWMVLRPAALILDFETDAAALALAGFLAALFTLTVLLGLHTARLSPQLAFTSAIVLAMSALLGAGVYALAVVIPRHRSARSHALLAAPPLILFEVLLSEWLHVYAIDRPGSMPSGLVIGALVLAAATTLLALSRAPRKWTSSRILTAFTLLVALAPLLLALGTRKVSAVRASDARSARDPQRIILITVDTLRADAVSAYRAEAPRTRAIDALAADGVVFDHAVAPSPWTLPSLTSILTGLTPAAHRTTTFTSTVSPNITTLAEYLSERGYETAAILHNDLLSPKNGLAQGFGEFTTFDEQYFAHSFGMDALQAVAPRWFPPPTWPSNDDETDMAIDWLEANRNRSFFLWVHYLDPHAPYSPPRQYRTADPLPTIGGSFEGQKVAAQGFFVPSVKEREAIRSLYDGEVQYVDACIGRIVAALKRSGVYDGSVIVFTSDHGEEFWEHGRLGHGHTMYEELLRVPLVVKLPGNAHRGRTGVPVSTASVTPTILDATRIRYDRSDLSAPSLMPLIDRSAGAYDERPIVSGAQILFDRQEAVSFDGFKYIVSSVDGTEQLFDLSADPGERRSIAASAPERLETGRRLLQAQATAAAVLRKRIRVEDSAVQADEDTVRRLRSLGYLR